MSNPFPSAMLRLTCAFVPGAVMKRREFINLISGVAATWPLAARAQQRRVPVVGFLRGGTEAGAANLLAAFRKGLSETGFVEGRNLTIEFR
jgi:putative ABC transport system substrate-binding protein